jgi:SMI1-KNR4 cell-wall
MMPIFADEPSLPPPPEVRIERLEASFERPLPPSYIAFIKAHNGAKLANPELPAAFGGRVIERFLPIVSDPAIDADGWADVAVVATQLDSRLAPSVDTRGFALVPIAALFGGDFLVLDYRNSADQPAVSVWYHDTSDDFAPDVRVIADSFENFLELLG